METGDNARYPFAAVSQSVMVKSSSNDGLRSLLEHLISSCEDLNVRVWLDGVYTDIGDEELHGNWMRGREVYFKVEGSVDPLRSGAGQ